MYNIFCLHPVRDILGVFFTLYQSVDNNNLSAINHRMNNQPL